MHPVSKLSPLPGVQVACCTMLWCQAFFGASETSTCRQTLKILAKLLRRNSAGVTAGVNDKVVRNHRMKATPTRTRKVFTTPTPHATGGEHGVLVLRIIYEPCDQSSQTHLSAWDQKVEKVLLLHRINDVFNQSHSYYILFSEIFIIILVWNWKNMKTTY